MLTSTSSSLYGPILSAFNDTTFALQPDYDHTSLRYCPQSGSTAQKPVVMVFQSFMRVIDVVGYQFQVAPLDALRDWNFDCGYF
jgi:hypothetical protein